MNTPDLVCPDCRSRFKLELADTADLIDDIKCPHCRRARGFSEYLIIVGCPACGGETAIPVSRSPEARFRCSKCGAEFAPETSEPKTEPAADAAPRMLRDGEIFEKYRIVRLLGRGGMAEVYLAEHLLLQRRCALKLMLEKKNAIFQKRFLREARCVRDLDHPNIVKIYDAGCDSATGRLFIAMEYVDGTPLSELPAGSFSEADLLKVAGDMAGALAALEAAHIVHRDIKPSNIIRDVSGNFKLMDLGIAKTESGSAGEPLTLTLERTVFGTPDYASPEQCRDAHRADSRSDIYSLGASLYHLASGHPPYHGATPVETILRVIQSPLEPLAKMRPDLSAPMCELVGAMLQKQPELRPQNAAALSALVADVKRGRWRGGRRSAVLWWGAVAAVAAVLLAVVAGLVLMRRGRPVISSSDPKPSIGEQPVTSPTLPQTEQTASPPPKTQQPTARSTAATTPKPRSTPSAQPPAALPPKKNELAISPELAREFSRYGVKVFVADYRNFPAEKPLDADDLNADARLVLDEFRRVGARYVQLSNCRRVVFCGRNVQAFSRADTLALNHGTVRRVRHTLVHRYDPFVRSYRYWRSLNAPGFFYVGPLRSRIVADATGFEILHAFAAAEAFEGGFAAPVGEIGEREDFATFADHTAEPGTAAKWRERARRDPVFKRKWYTAIAVCARNSGYDFWIGMYGFTPEEVTEIKKHDVDLEKLTGIEFAYADDPRRQGAQWRTVMVLAGLDRRLIEASGIRRVRFTLKDMSPELTGDTLTVNDCDAHGLVMTLFAAVCRRNPERMRQCGITAPVGQAAHLFHRCFFQMRDTAEKMAQSSGLYAEAAKLRKFTAVWMADDMWAELFAVCGNMLADRRFGTEFAKSGIEMEAPLPKEVTGEHCNFGDIRCGIRAFRSACSILTPEFIRASGIRKVAFARRMVRGGRRVAGGCVVGDTLCLDPGFNLLLYKVYYELFLAYERGRASDPKWLKLNPAKFRYGKPYRGGGFVSESAMANEMQDRAATFAFLLWNPYRAAVIADRSAILRAKIAYVRSLGLLNDYGVSFVDTYFRDR